jgi:hypothetical protein
MASNLTRQTGQKATARFSFLLPTRGRPEGVRQFLTSLVETTEELDQVEVILGVDDDDPVSQQIVDDRVRLKIVVFRHGLTMGAMNRACFEASCGRYVFLMNDDVVSCTKAWDRRVREAFEAFGDDIALVHVNDGIFGDKLCTFPLLSRQACQEIGLCPLDYRRYKIDDHIMETYTLLERLGYPRIVYLEDVLFRHDNYKMVADAKATAAFFAPGGRVYAPDLAISVQDASIYEEGIELRKSDALKLATLIDPNRNLDHLALRLSDVHDPYCYRRRRVAVPRRARGSRHRSRVAVGLVTGDASSRETARCLAALKENAGEVELTIVECAGSGLATRPFAMNRILAGCDAEFLLLLEEDVVLGDNVLDGLLDAMNDSIAVVAPLYENVDGSVASSGVYLLGPSLCAHADQTDRPETSRLAQAVRSGALLVDIGKCKGLRFTPQYRLGGFDVDFCLQVWEAGYQVACTPGVSARRSGRHPVNSDPVKNLLAQEVEEAVLTGAWIDNGRLPALSQRYWLGLAELQPGLEKFSRMARLIAEVDRSGIAGHEGEWAALKADILPFTLFRRYAVICLRHYLAGSNSLPGRETQACRLLLADLEESVPPPGLFSELTRKAMVCLARNIRQKPLLTRLAMGLTRRWRDLMLLHDDWPKWVRRLLSPVVARVESSYEYVSSVSAVESLGSFAGYRLVKFDGLVCGIPPSHSSLEVNRQLLLCSTVVIATTAVAAIRKIERIHASCGIDLTDSAE